MILLLKLLTNSQLSIALQLKQQAYLIWLQAVFINRLQNTELLNRYKIFYKKQVSKVHYILMNLETCFYFYTQSSFLSSNRRIFETNRSNAISFLPLLITISAFDLVGST